MGEAEPCGYPTALCRRFWPFSAEGRASITDIFHGARLLGIAVIFDLALMLWWLHVEIGDR